SETRTVSLPAPLWRGGRVQTRAGDDRKREDTSDRIISCDQRRVGKMAARFGRDCDRRRYGPARWRESRPRVLGTPGPPQITAAGHRGTLYGASDPPRGAYRR